MMPMFVEWAVKLLAIAGGAAIVGLGLGFVVGWMGRRFRVRALPRPVLFAFRGLGAVIGGWGVWLMVSAPGGSGLFGGGGSLFGEKGEGRESAKASITAAESPAKSSPQAADLPLQLQPLRVVMLGGPRVVQDRYYLIEGETEPRNLAELKQIIIEKQKTGMKVLEILIYDNSVAKDHSAVLDLEHWAEHQDLAVSKPTTKN